MQFITQFEIIFPILDKNKNEYYDANEGIWVLVVNQLENQT